MEVSSDPKPTITREQLLSLYRTMLVIRRTEETLAKAHQRGLIHGACHTYIGEEAIATGVCANRANRDKCGKWRPSALLQVRFRSSILMPSRCSSLRMSSATL